MAIDPSEFLRLRKDAEKALAEEQRLNGVLEQVLRQLEEEHGCKTEAEAEGKLASLERERQRLEEELERQLEELRDEGA
jgi:hypothetical protein